MGCFALVKNGVVENAIVADQDFIDAVTPAGLGVDLAIDISEVEPRPGPGWLYANGSFARNEG